MDRADRILRGDEWKVRVNRAIAKAEKKAKAASILTLSKQVKSFENRQAKFKRYEQLDGFLGRMSSQQLRLSILEYQLIIYRRELEARGRELQS